MGNYRKIEGRLHICGWTHGCYNDATFTRYNSMYGMWIPICDDCKSKIDNYNWKDNRRK